MDTRSWYTILVEMENHEKTRLLRMSAAEWKEEGRRMIRAWGKRDLREVLTFLEKGDQERKAYKAEQTKVTVEVAPRVLSEFEIDFAAWKDMVEEPWKYGESIVDWLALDAKLTAGSGRWRLHAYWLDKQAEEDAKQAALAAPWRALYSQIAKEAAVAGDRAWVRRDVKRHVARFRAETALRNAKRNAAATRIAAAVRGHQVRTASPYLNCYLCLDHVISPVRIPQGMACRGCAAEAE